MQFFFVFLYAKFWFWSISIYRYTLKKAGGYCFTTVLFQNIFLRNSQIKPYQNFVSSFECVFMFKILSILYLYIFTHLSIYIFWLKSAVPLLDTYRSDLREIYQSIHKTSYWFLVKQLEIEPYIKDKPQLLYIFSSNCDILSPLAHPVTPPTKKRAKE